MKRIFNWFKENGKWLVIYLVIGFMFICPLPYYIDAPGGLIDVSKRMKIEESYSSQGSFNLAYVTEYKANLPLILYSLINRNWKIYAKDEVVYDNETYSEALTREQIMLKASYANATIVGYRKANKEVDILDTDLFVTYLLEGSDTDLKIGDNIEKVEGYDINSMDDLKEAIAKYNVGDKIDIVVNNDGKELIRYATIKEVDNKKMIGISIEMVPKVKVNPEIIFHYDAKESGPSGGLMMALSIYNSLIREDLTGGLTIVGTGTIDIDGNVGAIGGVEFKLKGAVKKGADIFLVPNGDNYEEALKIKKDKNYRIEIIGVSTFDEAVSALKNYHTKNGH